MKASKINYLDKITHSVKKKMEFFRFSKKSWEKLITTENEDSCDEVALDLLDKMLKIDHVLNFFY